MPQKNISTFKNREFFLFSKKKNRFFLPSLLTFQIQSDLFSTQIFIELLISSRCCAINWEYIQRIFSQMQQTKVPSELPEVLVKILIARPQTLIRLSGNGTLGLWASKPTPSTTAHRYVFMGKPSFLICRLRRLCPHVLLPWKEDCMHGDLEQMLPAFRPYTDPRF